MKRALVVAAVLACSSIAHAEGGAPKSRTTAVLLSVGTTLGGWGVSIAGGATDDLTLVYVGGGVQTLGPTVGHWYAGEAVTPALVVRVVGTGILFAAMPEVVCLDGPCPDRDAATAVALAAAAATLGAAI